STPAHPVEAEESPPGGGPPAIESTPAHPVEAEESPLGGGPPALESPPGGGPPAIESTPAHPVEAEESPLGGGPPALESPLGWGPPAHTVWTPLAYRPGDHSPLWWWHFNTRKERHVSPDDQILELYHQTGEGVGPLILKHGFKKGKVGWCGGGIYFATNPWATETKAIGEDSHKGFMIKVRVNVGKVKQMPRHCGHMTEAKLTQMGFDSIDFDPGDGDEFVIYDTARIIDMVRIPWLWHYRMGQWVYDR
ncbi:unnamed protein product, partial [Polarella glacialis]